MKAIGVFQYRFRFLKIAVNVIEFLSGWICSECQETVPEIFELLIGYQLYGFASSIPSRSTLPVITARDSSYFFRRRLS